MKFWECLNLVRTRPDFNIWYEVSPFLSGLYQIISAIFYFLNKHGGFNWNIQHIFYRIITDLRKVSEHSSSFFLNLVIWSLCSQLAKYHEVRKSAIRHLKQFKSVKKIISIRRSLYKNIRLEIDGQIQWRYYFWKPWKSTFWNVSRVHTTFPNPLRTTGCWVPTIRMGQTRLTRSGNEYQSQR